MERLWTVTISFLHVYCFYMKHTTIHAFDWKKRRFQYLICWFHNKSKYSHKNVNVQKECALHISVHDVDTFIYSVISACLAPETPLEKFMPTFHAYHRYDFRKEYALQTFTTSYAIFYRQSYSSCTFRGTFLTHHLFNSAELSEQSTFPLILTA